jgi:ATP-dependent Lon protease
MIPMAPDRQGSEVPPEPPEEPTVLAPTTALAPIERGPPSTVLALALDRLVLFPGAMLPIALASGTPGQATLEQAEAQGQGLVAVLTRRPRGEPTEIEAPDRPVLDPKELFDIGCLGRIARSARLPDGSVGALLLGLKRLRVRKLRRLEPVMIAEVEYPDEVMRDVRQVEALNQGARRAFDELVPLHPAIPEETRAVAAQIEGAGRFADFCAALLPMDLERRLGFLSMFEIDGRLRSLLELLEREIDLAKLSAQTRDEIRKRVERTQRETYLREQLRAIRRELGEETDARTQEVARFEKLIGERQLPEEAAARAREELGRLSMLPQEAAEYHVIRTYLDWIVSLPWAKRESETLDLAQARKILEADHYGLEEVKARFLEFLAVRKLRAGQEQGVLLCLAGPPGVGKTSLGQSIARAMGRSFHRVSLGGMRDEAEIKGHRRTYVGAMPGKILQGLRRVGSRNPVFMLDEIDKLGSDWRGDPSSALLEVLDPAQNHAFVDHYLDLPFDLSEVMFIATANAIENIPGPLRDRLEILEIPGYVPDEKREIARRYLLPRQLATNGITASALRIDEDAIDEIIARYTREAGVRELERQLGRIARKVAARIAEEPAGTPQPVEVVPSMLPELLGPPRYRSEMDAFIDRPGISVGLAWTPTGGDVLLIEAAMMRGRGELKLTGRLGEVMAESAHIARSVVRARGPALGVKDKVFSENDLHLHVPAGAVPKDGPSAGITLAVALASLLTGRAIAPRLALTGELTLRGAVLPIGGLRNKLVAAKRAGVKTVVLPAGNRPDLGDVPERVREGLTLVFVEEFDEVLRAAGILGVRPRPARASEAAAKAGADGARPQQARKH